MPNEHNVYMHDAPMKKVFGRSTRAYSAGCVRVQRVFDLVAWLASANGDWDRARVDSVLMTGQQLDVPLNAEVDVFFTYLTAYATPDGDVSFREDIYGWDGSADVLAQQQEAPTAETLQLRAVGVAERESREPQCIACRSAGAGSAVRSSPTSSISSISRSASAMRSRRWRIFAVKCSAIPG